jgi:hypothetical protein
VSVAVFSKPASSRSNPSRTMAETRGLPPVGGLVLSNRARKESSGPRLPQEPHYGNKAVQVLAERLREIASLLLSFGALLYRWGNELSTPLPLTVQRLKGQP